MKKIYFFLIVFCHFMTANAQIVNIPDANFKARLLAASPSKTIAKDLNGNYIKIDVNSNGEIETNEVLLVKDLDVYLSNISDLSGIQSFMNLTSLVCESNQLTSLDLSGLKDLTHLYCQMNQLTSLNLSGLTNLTTLYCYQNELIGLDLAGLTNLVDFRCIFNKLTSLDLSGLPNLWNLECANNQLTSLDLSGLTKLEYLFCLNNQLTDLDLSGLTKLSVLNCRDNQLASICIKNGKTEQNLIFSNNPNLKYICADDSEISAVKSKLDTYGYTNCQVNSYCFFTPGGTYYTIQGTTKLGNDNNGCGENDTVYPNLKISITDGTTIGGFISNASGNYSIPVQAGTHTIIPIIENPSYFNISPANFQVTFPTETSPFTQNFCIIPNGVHNDLEVSVMSLLPARPGFDAKYKVIYKNKGTSVQSGTVSVNFDDAILDFVTANPTISTLTLNNLSWDFSNLQPFETREIVFTVNINSPMETPAVNSGDVLHYTVTISSAATDETPADNTFELNQTVVNSLDPNDKTCLEGNVITPALIGQYVHYMIRFENTGTYPAENIVVKDMIDLSKFDISTLVPTSASHSFVTRITEGNKVEFIFENINLPFDDANNDGYITFKIKTLPTLLVGDSFVNEASIYFDYNFPVVTNKATSTFQALSVQDFEFSNYFSLYPNPAKDVLKLSAIAIIEVDSIGVYNTLGQMVIAIPNAETVCAIDVANLTSGTYFVKVNTDKGTSNAKFIKN